MAASPVSVHESRHVPVPTDKAYRGALTVPLERLFCHRHLALPPIRAVRDQHGVWGSGGVGQTRTIVTADRGSFMEELTLLEPGERFGYTLSRITGPMKPMVSFVEGRWTITPTGTGSTVTWSWTIHPRSVLTSPAVELVGRMWHGYAAKALLELEKYLLK
jgi:hypothetical protein